MKNLQDNFTSPEQSKRLLKMGVPADSADCYTAKNGVGICTIGVLQEKYTSFARRTILYGVLPCWSVGRLIEIMTICSKETNNSFVFSHTDGLTIIGNIIRCIQLGIECGRMDFSKLEEEE